MIKKIIGCADIHFPSYRGIEELKEVLSTFIEKCKAITEEIGQESVRIVIAGDIVDSKINITNESIMAVNWFFKELDKVCKTIVIAGNHDLLMNNMDRVDSLSSIFEIADYKNVVYLDKELGYKSGCYEDDNIVWCLYSTFDEFNTPSIKSAKELYGDKHYVGLIHADINGATSATEYECTDGLEPSVFDGLEFVIAGHIHKYQTISNGGIPITYCSSLKQQCFGETVSKHGFVLWEENNGSYKSKMIEVENDKYNYYVFKVNDVNDIKNDKEIVVNL